MSSRIYVSTIEASYFETHILGCSASPPVTGTYTIGDIFISSIQQNDVFGWVCVEAGSPGVWKIICDVTLIKDNIQENTTNINKLLEFMKETKDNISGINTKNNNQDSQISQLIKDLESLNKLVTESDNSLIGAVHSNIEEIQKLTAEVANNKQGINKNKEDLTSINDQINNINNSMNTVSSQVIINTGDINKLKGEIDNISDIVDGNISDIGELGNLRQDVDKNTETIKDIEINVKNNSSIISGIQQDMADLIGDVENNTNDMGELQKEVSDLQGTVNNNSKDIDNIQNEIDGIKDIISDDSEQESDELINIRKDVDANKQEIDDLKQGLVDALVNKGVDVDNTTSWLDLFKEMLNQLGGSNPDPEEPVDPEPENPDPEEPVDPEPENPEASIKLFNEGSLNSNTDFGTFAFPSSTISDDITNDQLAVNLGTSGKVWSAFCLTNEVNFNNYDALSITLQTENKQQTNTNIIVGRGSNTTMTIGEGDSIVKTVDYEETTSQIMTNTTTPQTYVFSFEDIRQGDSDIGLLGIQIEKGDGDGFVYISDISVYKEGEYYPR